MSIPNICPLDNRSHCREFECHLFIRDWRTGNASCLLGYGQDQKNQKKYKTKEKDTYACESNWRQKIQDAIKKSKTEDGNGENSFFTKNEKDQNVVYASEKYKNPRQSFFVIKENRETTQEHKKPIKEEKVEGEIDQQLKVGDAARMENKTGEVIKNEKQSVAESLPFGELQGNQQYTEQEFVSEQYEKNKQIFENDEKNRLVSERNTLEEKVRRLEKQINEYRKEFYKIKHERWKQEREEKIKEEERKLNASLKRKERSQRYSDWLHNKEKEYMEKDKNLKLRIKEKETCTQTDTDLENIRLLTLEKQKYAKKTVENNKNEKNEIKEQKDDIEKEIDYKNKINDAFLL